MYGFMSLSFHNEVEDSVGIDKGVTVARMSQ
jgi:hypothetical protein